MYQIVSGKNINNISNRLDPNKNLHKLATSKCVKYADKFFSSITGILSLHANVSRTIKKNLKYSVMKFLKSSNYNYCPSKKKKYNYCHLSF